VTLYIEEKGGAVVLRVLVQPRASKNELAGVHGDCLKIRVTSPPVEDQANKKLCAFLSKLIGVGKKQVEVVGGHKTRVKKVRISNASMDEVRKKLS
jgi:uncharacterized protein (TIGR00251 family)